MLRRRASAIVTAASAVALAGSAAAQQAAAPAAQPLSIELNKSADTAAGCRLTFVAKNDTGSAIDKASYEIAVFDSNNQVARLLIFEFGSLALGKTKVVEFEYPNLKCGGLSRILVNTSPECVVAGTQASPVCLTDLKTSSLSTIAFNQ
jgi:hypothetical protein